MNAISFAYHFVSGAALFNAVLHLAIGWRLREKKYLLIGAASLSAAVFCFSQSAIYASATVGGAYEAYRFRIGAAVLVTIALLWFASERTGLIPLRLKWGLTFFFTLFGLVRTFAPNAWVFQDGGEWRSVSLPWGETVSFLGTKIRMSFSLPLSTIPLFFIYLCFVFGWYSKKKRDAESRMLFIAQLLLTAGSFIDLTSEFRGLPWLKTTGLIFCGYYVAAGVFCLSDLRRSVRSGDRLDRMAHEKFFNDDRIESLSGMASGVAHEISNPDGIIRLNHSSLKKIWGELIPLLSELPEEKRDVAGMPLESLEENVARLLDGIEYGADRIHQIVDRLAQFSRRKPEVNGTADLHQALHAAIAEPEAGKDVNLDLCRDRLRVKGEQRLVEETIQSLWRNAIDFSDGGKISVSTFLEPSKQYAVFRIVDEGVGMNEKQVLRAGEPFHTTRRERGHAGLGLWFVNRAMHECGGKWEIRAEPGKGVGIHLYFIPAV
ncbi:MAG: hypothetical protein JNM63_07295 [Spirochaetia bacterium]|nr:hypothetical protein [Spirochaetia bacterium]